MSKSNWESWLENDTPLDNTPEKIRNWIVWNYTDPDTKEVYGSITQEHSEILDGPWPFGDEEEHTIEILIKEKDSFYGSKS